MEKIEIYRAIILFIALIFSFDEYSDIHVMKRSGNMGRVFVGLLWTGFYVLCQLDN